MKINFNQVKLENFLSAGRIIFDFTKGTTQILGENRTDTYSTSNGSGKSCIIESVIWCLTGSTSRGIKSDEVINQFINGDTKVELTLECNSIQCVITRGRGTKNYLTIIKDGVDCSGATTSKSQKIIDGLLPLDFEDLTTCIILSQDMPGKLSSQSPSGRKSTLESIANYADKVESLKGTLNNHVKSLEKDRDKVEDFIQKYDRLIIKDQATQEQIKKNIITLKNDADNYIASLDNYTKESLEYSKKSKEYGDKVSNLEDKIIPSSTIELEVSNTKHLVTDIESKSNVIHRENKKLEREINTLKEEGNKLGGNTCPTCGQCIDDLTVLEKLKETNRLKIEKSEREIEENLEKVNNLENELAELEVNLNNQLADLNKIENENSKIKSELQQTKNMLFSLVNPSKPIEVDWNVRITALEKELSELDKNINTNNQKVEQVKGYIEGYEERLTIAKKIVQDVSRGTFRTFLLNKAMGMFNSILNSISLAMMQDSRVYLELDGNNVDIKYKNKRYEQMSGGERKRIDIAIELTKRKYKQLITGVEFDTLVMDEVTDSLDVRGINAIFDAVEVSGACNKFIIISHRADACVDYDRQVTVIKENNISRLEV